MKKKNTKAVILLAVFAVLTAAMILLGNARQFYKPCIPEEGEALTAQNWLCAVWWLLTAAFAAAAVSRFAHLSGKIPAGVKLGIYAVAVLVLFAGLVMATADLGVNINAMIICLGVIGTCFAIGCEPMMYDVMGGLGIISGRDFEIGDIITVDGFRGTVIDITLRCVKLQDAGGNVRIVRNSEIASVVNLSGRESAAVVRIPFDPSEDDLAAFEKQLNACIAALAEEHGDVFKEKPEYKGVDAYSAEGAELLVVAKVPEERVYEARRLMNRAFILLKQAK